MHGFAFCVLTLSIINPSFAATATSTVDRPAPQLESSTSNGADYDSDQPTVSNLSLREVRGCLDDEISLMREFNIEGAEVEDMLGIDDESEDEYDEFDGGNDLDLADDGDYHSYRQQVRVDAAQRAELARRPGDIRIQAGVRKDWDVSRGYSDTFH